MASWIAFSKTSLRLGISVFTLFASIGLLRASDACAGRLKLRPSLRPAWVDDYRVRTGGGRGKVCALNASYLLELNRKSPFDEDWMAPYYDPAQARTWRQNIENLTREYEMRMHAGLLDPEGQRGYFASIGGFGNGVWDEMQKRQMSYAERKANAIIERHATIEKAMAPGVIAAGVYVGRPVPLRLTDDTLLRFTTNVRDRYGAVEMESPLGFGVFEYRPMVAANRDLGPNSAVDFGAMMNMGWVVDYSQERYQLTLKRPLPFFGLSTQLLYGASSNSVAGSLSKQVLDNLTCVVDSVHRLAPIDSIQADEQRLRLRYDFRF
ncbi:hypothetical protein WDW37_03885 [Bdellovibrionota bacterium FG-1]